jgi:cobyric acid synthase
LPLQHYFRQSQEQAFNDLAQLVRENLSMERIYQSLEFSGGNFPG